MKKLLAIIISVFAVVGLAVIPLAPAAVAAPVDSIKEGVGGIGGNESQPTLEDGLKTIVNVLLFVIGAVAVIMLIIGGLRYTTSNGDASAIKGAKDTILYAIIGIVVAILAYAIVNFVVGAF